MDESISMANVNLIVKASNQQYDDQNIECQPTWTIRKLKEHLCDVYPSKPKPDDQKLIYSGQLLKDTLILKDILRHYEGIQQQKHTFHLVCTPKQKFPVSSSSSSSSSKKSNQQQQNSTGTSSDGLRQRKILTTTVTNNQNVDSSSSSSSSVTVTAVPNIPSSSVPIFNGNCPSFMGTGTGLFNPIGFQQQFQMSNDHLLAQQAAMQNWMQQAYVQYMNQYMNLMSTGIRPEAVLLRNSQSVPMGTTAMAMPPITSISGGNALFMPYVAQNFPFTAAYINSNENNPAISRVSPSVQTPQTQQQIPEPAVAPEPQNPPQPRYPNIIQDDIQENRDWLDVFYSFSRLILLLIPVYLYSSPIRCLIVFIIGMGIYLYHNSYFRMRTLRQDDNNNGAVRQPQQPNNDVDGAVDPAAPEQQQNNENSATTEQETVPTNETENADGTSMLALLRTFVVSFIVSLLPETPPV